MPKTKTATKSAAAKPRSRAKTAAITPPAATFPPLVMACLHALEEKKAENPQVIDVRGQSNITDFHILATGTSEPHLRALRIEVEKAILLAGSRVIGSETKPETGWIIVDAFDAIIHLFTASARAFYSLETLWQDSALSRQKSLQEEVPPK